MVSNINEQDFENQFFATQKVDGPARPRVRWQPPRRRRAPPHQRLPPTPAVVLGHPLARPAHGGARTGRTRNPQPPRRRRRARTPLRGGRAVEVDAHGAYRIAAPAGGGRREPVATGGGTRISVRRHNVAAGPFALPVAGRQTTRDPGGNPQQPAHVAGTGPGGGKIETGQLFARHYGLQPSQAGSGGTM